MKISLVVNYAGQAAWLMHSKATKLNDANPFFEMLPHWALLPGIIVATAAA